MKCLTLTTTNNKQEEKFARTFEIEFIIFSFSFFVSKVPVTANILLPKGRVFSVGTDISLYCNVTGEPIPDVTWYKDNRPLEPSNHVEIPGEMLN